LDAAARIAMHFRRTFSVTTQRGSGTMGEMRGGRPGWWSRLRLVVLAMVVVAVGGSLSAAGAVSRTAGEPEETLRILVTNDDGIGAPGITAVVNALQALPNVEVTVIAPAVNQSGTGANFNTNPITVAPGATATGDTGTAVSGFPADTVLYGVLTAMPQPPHVVVSGINLGQNLGNITELSGTVGAARTANRLGIPAIAVSQGFGTTVSYNTAAIVTHLWVDALRPYLLAGTDHAQTFNINVPTCNTGAIRGAQFVPLGRTSDVSGYTLQSGTVGNGTFAPNVVNKNPIATADCTSTATDFDNDIDAFNNGFITYTVLNRDLGDR
jgi:5'-nucleotidase